MKYLINCFFSRVSPSCPDLSGFWGLYRYNQGRDLVESYDNSESLAEQISQRYSAKK